jgi:hypothetical protein
MRKILIMVFFGLLAGLIIYLLVTNPGAFNKIYLWVIGLFGIITWPFRKLWDWMNSNDDLDKIEQNNKQLKLELEQIKRDLALAQSKLEAERQKNKLKIAELEKKIQLEDQIGHALQKELAELKNQTVDEFKDSLKLEDRKKIQDDMFKDVDFGL